MKKLFTLLVGVLCSISAMATTFTFTSSESVTQTTDGYTVKIEKGNGNNAPAYYDNGLRLYASNTITVSGANIENIYLTFSMQGSKAYADLTASTGNLVSGGTSTSSDDKVTDKWTGSASSVTFTLGGSGQRLIHSIVVNGDGSENPGGGSSDSGSTTDPDTPSELDPDFQYPDPTILDLPPLSVQGDAYSFIYNNILVSSTKGAITDSYFSAHAGYELTFTATKPIKGIVINGYVRKDFSATVNNGSISYLSPGSDTEANPVVVIKNIDSNSVTISCVKQLRCYTVEIYFDENPSASISGGVGEGEEINLIYDSADAVYESEYAELLGEPNYSVFLFNEASPEVPYFALDLYPASKDNLAGTYTRDDYTLGDYTYYVYGYGDNDFTWAEDGTVTISKSGDIYTITGTIICDNNNTYHISFTGQMAMYNDDEYYGDGGEDTAVEEIKAEASSADSSAYDLNGRKVRPNYRGIVIRAGKKELLK